MIGIYLIGAVAIGILLYVFKSHIANVILTLTFILLQCVLTVR